MMRPSLHHTIDFATINAAALAVLPSLVARWLPNGRRVGHEWVVGSIRGEPGNSLKVNLRTGVWRDFAEDIGGSDPISLAAAVAGLGQADAARHLAKCLRVPHD
jgi:hypothetical protein